MAYIDNDEDVVYLPFYEADEPRNNENIYKLGNPYKNQNNNIHQTVVFCYCKSGGVIEINLLTGNIKKYKDKQNKNPSSRAQSVTIQFDNEHDNYPFNFNILQHKGETLITNTRSNKPNEYTNFNN